MKRLFCVRRKSPRVSVIEDDNGEPLYFPNKILAKHHRDRLNQETKERTFVVSLGPDHRRYVKQ